MVVTIQSGGGEVLAKQTILSDQLSMWHRE